MEAVPFYTKSIERWGVHCADGASIGAAAGALTAKPRADFGSAAFRGGEKRPRSPFRRPDRSVNAALRFECGFGVPVSECERLRSARRRRGDVDFRPPPGLTQNAPGHRPRVRKRRRE